MNTFNSMRNLLISLSVFALSALVGCTQTSNKEKMVSTEEVVATDSVNMISYYEQFLGCNIDSIPHIANYQKESKKEYGDEGVSWKTLNFSIEGKNAISMETNWEDTIHISRITISSDKIRMGNVYIGQTIASFKNKVPYSIEPCQDGYLLLQLDKHKNIHLQMNLSNVSPDSPLWLGECSVNEIPDTLCIESIVLSND